jgi:hypothetical protein
MLTTGGNKGIGKSGQRKEKTERRGKKAPVKSQAGLKAEPKPDQLQDAQDQIREQIEEQTSEVVSAPVASIEIYPPETSAPDIVPTAPALSAEPVTVSVATIANAYGAYTGKSVELTWSFLQKLATAPSLDKAFEVQTEFAKQVFENFFAESRKIHALHSELARQRVAHLEGVVSRISQTTFLPATARH